MIKWLRLVILILCVNLQVQAQFNSVNYSIQAHQDDWQLFWSSRVITAMSVANSKMVFITLTAGDASSGINAYGGGGPFYLSRETGSMFASKFAADLTTGTAPLDLPVVTTVTINSHTITKYVYKNTVNYFLRLPDGEKNGSGFTNNHDQSLLRLRGVAPNPLPNPNWWYSIPAINVIGNTSAAPLSGPPLLTYTWDQLVATVKAIINLERIPGTQSWVFTADERTVAPYNFDDHTDHIAASYVAQQAVTTFPALNWVGLDGYLAYTTSTLPVNLSKTQIENASILFGLEVLGMTEERYHNDYLPDAGHLAWLPNDTYNTRRPMPFPNVYAPPF
ncbi:MAG TPA: hypothetical protein VK498_07900 [Ferruginibacter sp.]|nr:hypothetical protein [Ferruginibacter sp.]